MKPSRRQFIGVTTAALAAAPFSSCKIGKLEASEEELYSRGWSPHEEQWSASLCDLCAGGCGIEARSRDGVVVGLRGNPRSPVNRGGLCPRGFALLQVTHHPDRVTQPLRRVGDKHQPISWDEALGEIAQRLKELRLRGTPERLVIVSGGLRGLAEEALERFAQGYGTPNVVSEDRYDYHRPAVSHRLAMGVNQPVAYDFQRATYVLSFGGNLLEDGPSPVHQMRTLAEARTRAQGQARYVEVGSRPSISAGKADRWIAIAPGTEAALAMGMAYVIVREGLYDRSYVASAVHGFEDWTDADGTRHEGFKSFVLANHSPKKTEGLTGVPVTTVIEEARWFAQSPCPIAFGEPPDPFGADDTVGRLAILALNALVGAMGKPGGLLLQPRAPLNRLPEPHADDVAAAGLAWERVDGAGTGPFALARSAVQSLPGRIQSGAPYPTEALLLIRANPVFSHPLGRDFEKAIEKVPFVAAVTTFMDENSRLAHIVLPESTPVESWTEDEMSHLPGFTSVSVGRPAMAPKHDTRPAYEMLAGVAARLGGPVAAALPIATIEEAIRERAKGLWDAKRGYVIRERKSEDLRRVIQNQGYWNREHPDFDSFFDALVKAGGWWDPDNAIPAFRKSYATPSRKYEIDSSALRAAYGRMGRAASSASGLPEYHPQTPAIPAGAAENYPYQLATFTPITSLERHSVNVPLLQELGTPHFEDQAWLPWLEIDPRLGKSLGIEDREEVWVISPKARVRTIARHVPGRLERVIHMPRATGHWSTGRWTSRREAEPAMVLMDVADGLKGIGVPTATFVRLEKVG